MDVPLISRTSNGASDQNSSAETNQSQLLRGAATAARALNDLNIADREFKVVRDPTSQRFVIVVLEQSTGAVLDQYPPESVIKMLNQQSNSGAQLPQEPPR
jgi:uncharacterized FlaG/YvyC family protein